MADFSYNELLLREVETENEIFTIRKQVSRCGNDLTITFALFHYNRKTMTSYAKYITPNFMKLGRHSITFIDENNNTTQKFIGKCL